MALKIHVSFDEATEIDNIRKYTLKMSEFFGNFAIYKLKFAEYL